MPNQVTQEDWQKLDERVHNSQLAVAALNYFGMNLLRAVAHDKQGQNVFLSPLSVFLALAMTEGGSAGSTRAAMRKTLGLPEREAAVLNESMDALQRVLSMPGGAQLLSANALWTAAKAPVSPEFVIIAEAVFRAHAASLAFTNPNAAKQINAWVSEQTNGKIPEIVTPDMVRSAVVILTNAVYFAGKWHSPFAKTDTHDEPFHHADGTTKTVSKMVPRMVPMMRHPDLKLAYRAGEYFEGAALRYQASSMYFYALLPDKGKSPGDVLARLDPAKLNASGEYDVDLKLPRFSLDFGSSLASYLKTLGMDVAFHHPEADFRPMGSELLFISDVIHKTRLEVDEEGTVAAAATAVLMGAGAGMPKPREKKILVFDRPFVVVISDARTGALLFAGSIEQP